MSVLDNNDYESECPYCYKYKQNFMGKLSRLLKNREKKDISSVRCLECDEIYYYASYKTGHSFMPITLSYALHKITFTKEIYNKKYNNNPLLDYLPTEELKTRYLDLQSVERINPKYMTLRTLIDAYIAYKHETNENSSLATAIVDAKDKKIISDEAQKLLSFINKHSNISAHSKADKIPDKNVLEQAIAFIILTLTEEFYLPKRKEEIELKRKALLEEIENEKSQLEQDIKNQKANLMELKNSQEKIINN